MKDKMVIWLILVGIMIGVILYSFGDEINILHVKPFSSKYLLWTMWGLVPFLSSFLWDLFLKKDSLLTAILICMGIPLGIIINIILDIKINSSSHSLLGLELLVIAFIFALSFLSTLIGIGLSQLILFFRRRLK